MQKRMAAVVIAVATVWAVGSSPAAQSSEPWVGTWKVNLDKSTYSPGPKPSVPGTAKMEATGGGIKLTLDGTTPQGQPTHTEMMGAFDGKDNPITGALAPNSTAAFTRIDNRTIEVIGKVDGKPVITTRVEVSADGRTLTATQTGTTPDGSPVKNVIVAEKQ